VGLSGVDNLLSMLQTIHEYARNGSLTLELKGTDPGMVVKDAIAISRMDLLFRLRKVECAVDPHVPQLQADRQKLTQVLVNLVRNALHATEDGGAVRIVARPVAEGAVEFAVEDDGPGVPPERRGKLFQPFVSAKGEQGLGLGLYMAKLIVESHRGRIRLADRPRGARFEVVLPTKDGVSIP
jgi:signal transduction histidine kinase